MLNRTEGRDFPHRTCTRCYRAGGTPGWYHFPLGAILLLALGLATAADGACDLQIVSAGPCLADSTSGIPGVGTAYGLKVIIDVKGTPSQPFRIRWTMANVTYYFDNISVGPGNGYWWYFVWWVDLDDPIPWSVTLDPDGVSGNTNLSSNAASGAFTPIPPSTPVELYAPRLMHGFETYTLDFQAGSGTINDLWVLFGVPTSHGARKAWSVCRAPPTAKPPLRPSAASRCS